MLLALALNGSAGEGAAGIESASERILFTPSSTACNAEVLGNVQLDLVICKKKCHMPEQLLGLRPTFASQSLGVGALVVKTCMLLADLFFFHIFYVSTRLRGVCCSCYSFVHCLLQICVSLVFCLFCASAVCLYTFQCCLVAFLVIRFRNSRCWTADTSFKSNKRRDREREGGRAALHSLPSTFPSTVTKAARRSHVHRFLKESQAKSVKRIQKAKNNPWVATDGRWLQPCKIPQTSSGAHSLAPKKKAFTTWWLGTESLHSRMLDTYHMEQHAPVKFSQITHFGLGLGWCICSR